MYLFMQRHGRAQYFCRDKMSLMILPLLLETFTPRYDSQAPPGAMLVYILLPVHPAAAQRECQCCVSSSQTDASRSERTNPILTWESHTTRTDQSSWMINN